ncbi:MAG: PGF-pre-PGF domain-containing protein [Methanomicrobia archaeon]|nr:PGF-pre-PGF domain-containing protein [Methanomicrobia archaeon]
MKADVTVKNMGDTQHTFYIGYSVKDKNGKLWDAPYTSASLGKGSSITKTLYWSVPSNAPEGPYSARVAVYKSKSGDLLQDRLDYKEKSSAFDILITSKVKILDIKTDEKGNFGMITVVLENKDELNIEISGISATPSSVNLKPGSHSLDIKIDGTGEGYITLSTDKPLAKLVINRECNADPDCLKELGSSSAQCITGTIKISEFCTACGASLATTASLAAFGGACSVGTFGVGSIGCFTPAAGVGAFSALFCGLCFVDNIQTSYSCAEASSFLLMDKCSQCSSTVSKIIVTQLDANPSSVNPGESVLITVAVKNEGDAEGSKDLDIKVNGEIIKKEEVTIEAHESKMITTSVVKSEPGSYIVSVDDKRVTFSVVRSSLTITKIEPELLRLGEVGTIYVTLKNEDAIEFKESQYDVTLSFRDYYKRGGSDSFWVRADGNKHGSAMAILQEEEIKNVRIPSFEPGAETTVNLHVNIDKYAAPSLIFADTLGVTIQSDGTSIPYDEYKDLDVIVSEKQALNSIKTAILSLFGLPPLCPELIEEHAKLLDDKACELIMALQRDDPEAAAEAYFDMLAVLVTPHPELVIDAIKNMWEGSSDIALLFLWAEIFVSEAIARGYDLTVVEVHSPVDVLVTSPQGQQVGYYEGKISEEINGSCVIVKDNKKIIMIPGRDNYTIKLKGTDEGIMSYYAITPTGENAYTSVKYEDIPVEGNTLLTTQIQKYPEDTNLSIDRNADGVVDEIRDPDTVMKEGKLPKNVSVEVIRRIGNLLKDQQLTMVLERTDVTNVEIETINTISDVKILIQELESKPGEIVDAPGIAYSYLNIETENLNEEDIANVNIAFKVRKSWIEENNVDETSIKLNRFFEGEWTSPATEKILEDEVYLYYKTESAGLSNFAITGQEKVEKIPIITPTQKSETDVPGFEALFVLVGFVAAMCLLGKRTK